MTASRAATPLAAAAGQGCCLRAKPIHAVAGLRHPAQVHAVALTRQAPDRGDSAGGWT